MIALGYLISAAAAISAGVAGQENARSVSAINAVEEHWSRAFVGGDAAYLNGLLASDYVSVSAKGVAHSKSDVIEASRKYAATNPPAYVPQAPSPVTLSGDIAIVRHRSDKDVSVDVFQFRSNRWVALYSQHTTPGTP